MSILKTRLEAQLPELREARRQLLKERGDAVVSTVNVRQLAGGMRGVNALICDTSVVEPEKGLIIRGIPVAQLADKSPEEVFFLLVVGELPTKDELAEVQADMAKRRAVPRHVWQVIEALPEGAHPMAALTVAVTALESRSLFREQYEIGMPREDYWDPALEDSLDLLAALPEIAGGIYRTRVLREERISPNPSLDWAGAYAAAMGIKDEKFVDYLRVATIVQSDHEGAHASALSAHIVGSTLADVYYAVPAGWNALAGPLHGLASQVCLRWVLAAMERYGGALTDEQIREYADDTIAAGRVIPGYGHAVLRGQDPRYLAILAFGEKNAQRDPVFKTVKQMSRVIPSALMAQGKVKNPWPNVDAINGALFHHFGVKDIPFYTVFFATALAFGFCAQYVLNRALMTPITRPRSVTTEWVEKHVPPGN